MATLPTNYVDDQLAESMGGKRHYNMTTDAHGIYLTDVTEYTQRGSTFAAAQINETNTQVNENTSALTNKLGKTDDTKNNTTTFTSADTSDSSATSWTSVSTLSSGLTHATLLNRISAMMKNVRYLYNRLFTNSDLINSISYIYTSSNVTEIYVYRCGRLIYIFFVLINTPTSSGFDVLYINGYNLPFSNLVGVGWGNHQSDSDFSINKPCYVKVRNSNSNICVSINTTAIMKGSIDAFGIIPIT